MNIHDVPDAFRNASPPIISQVSNPDLPAGTVQGRRFRWEQRTAIPLMVAATAQLVGYIWVAGLDDRSNFLTILNVLVWLLFLGDYLVRLALVQDSRWRFVRSHPLDLIAVVLPAFRVLRVISAIVRLLAVAQRGIAERVLATTVLVTSTLWAVGAAAVRQAENGAPGANITNYPDALWWSGVTMTTVGYGDLYPVTTSGRIYAGMLMVTGIVAMGALTGALVSKILRDSQAKLETEEVADLKAKIQELEKQNE